VNGLRGLEAGAQITAGDDVETVEVVRVSRNLGGSHEGNIRLDSDLVNPRVRDER
jgi:hypothetical protein